MHWHACKEEFEEKGTLSGCKNWKLEGFRFFQVEEIYTEKMITLSNVSHDPPWVGDVSRQQGDPELWLPGRDHFFFSTEDSLAKDLCPTVLQGQYVKGFDHWN